MPITQQPLLIFISQPFSMFHCVPHVILQQMVYFLLLKWQIATSKEPSFVEKFAAFLYGDMSPDFIIIY